MLEQITQLIKNYTQPEQTNQIVQMCGTVGFGAIGLFIAWTVNNKLSKKYQKWYQPDNFSDRFDFSFWTFTRIISLFGGIAYSSSCIGDFLAQNPMQVFPFIVFISSLIYALK